MAARFGFAEVIILLAAALASRAGFPGRSEHVDGDDADPPVMPTERNGPGHWCDRAVGGGIFSSRRSEVLEEFQERVPRLEAFPLAAGLGSFSRSPPSPLLMHVGNGTVGYWNP